MASSRHRQRKGRMTESESPFPFDLILEGRWRTIVRLCGSKGYKQPEPAPLFLPAVLLKLLRERRRVEQAKCTGDNVMEGANDANLQECLLEAIVRFGESDCIEEYAMVIPEDALGPCGPLSVLVGDSSCSTESPSATDFELASAEHRVIMVLGELKKTLVAVENGCIQEDMMQASQSHLLCLAQLEPDFVLLLPVILSQLSSSSLKPSFNTCNVTASLICTSLLAPSLVSCLVLNDPTTLNDALQGILKVWHLHPRRAANVAVELATLSPSAARATRLCLMQMRGGVTLPACIRISTTILCDPECFALMASPGLLIGLRSNAGCAKSLISGIVNSLSSTMKLDDSNGKRIRKHCLQAICRLSEYRVARDDTLELFGNLVEKFNGQVYHKGLAPLIVITACVVVGPHCIKHLESAFHQVATSMGPQLAILALMLIRGRRFEKLFSVFSKICNGCVLPQQKIDTSSWETAATAISQLWSVSRLTDILVESILLPVSSDHKRSSSLMLEMECVVVALGAGFPIKGQALREWVIWVVDIGLTLHPLPSILLELIENVARACFVGKEKEVIDILPHLNEVACIPPFMPKVVTASLRSVKWEHYSPYYAKDGLSVACQEHDRGIDHQPPSRDLCRALLHLYFALCYMRIGSESMEPFSTPFIYNLRSLPLRRALQTASSIPCLRTFHTKLLKEIHLCSPELFCPVRVMKDSSTSPWTNVRYRRPYLEDSRHHCWDEVWSEQAAAAKVLCHSSFSIGNNPNIAVSALQSILHGPDDALLQRGEAIIRSILPAVCDALDVFDSSSNTTMKRAQLDIPLSLLSGMWHRLHTIHAHPQVLEALTINILLQRERRIGIFRVHSFRTLLQEPLLIFRCRRASFSNYQILSIVLSCLRSLLLASKYAILQAARRNSFIQAIEHEPPPTLCPGGAATAIPVNPTLPSDGSAAKGGSNGSETSVPSCVVVNNSTGNDFAGNNPPPQTGGGFSSQPPFEPTRSRFVSPQMMLQVQGLIVTRCVLNICDGAMGTNGAQIQRTLFPGCPNPCNTIPVASSLILESASGFLQILFAEDPILSPLLLDQTFPLRWMPILLHCVPAFVSFASPSLVGLLECNTLEKVVFGIQASSLFAEVYPSLSVVRHQVKNVCREAFKAAASIVEALSLNGPDYALSVLEDLSHPLASIGCKYPELASDIASLLMRINNKLQGVGGGGGVGRKWAGQKVHRNSSAKVQEALQMLTCEESGVVTAHLSFAQ